MVHFKHLEEVNQGYFEHMKGALGLAGSCMKAACVLVVHAVNPDLFDTTGTKTLETALEKLKQQQTRNE